MENNIILTGLNQRYVILCNKRGEIYGYIRCERADKKGKH